jgi:4-hydroxy-3-polyprenylbenzoate decarboxylase
MFKKPKIVVAITGASGSIYAQRLLMHLNSIRNQFDRVDVVLSSNAGIVWEHELQNTNYKELGFKIYDKNDFNAPFASGSAGYDSMIICPASMGTLGRIAHGISNDLISRAADVMLKERKQLIIVPRETPYNLIHLRNLTQIAEAGGVVMPATPSFYSRPQSIEEVVDTVVFRIIQMAGLEIKNYKWGEE